MSMKNFLCFGILSAAALLHAYKQPDYENLRWTDPVTKAQIRGPKSYACGVHTIPKRNDLLEAKFENRTIELDTRKFYAVPGLQKEVIIGFYGIKPEDGVRLKEGEFHGKQWNCFRLKIKGTPGSKVALVFDGKRDKKYNSGHYRVDKFFTLDGAEQTIEFKKEFPSDLQWFVIRLDLKTAGVFRFSAPEFFVEDRQEKAKTFDSKRNYIENGGAENGYDSTIYIPIERRKHVVRNAYINFRGEPEMFKAELALDSKIVHSGKYSFRLRHSGKGAMTSRVDSFAFHPVPIHYGEKYNYSLWLRAERPTTVEMTLCGGHGFNLAQKHVKIGKDWKRYEVRIPSLGKDKQGQLSHFSMQAGVVTPILVIPPNVTVWIDDACVSIGSYDAIPETRTMFFRSGKLDERNHYYIAGKPVKVSFSMEQITEAPMKGVLSWELFDYFGKSVKQEKIREMTLAPNQVVSEEVSLKMPENMRGPMRLELQFENSAKQIFRKRFYLGVIGKPGKKNLRFSLECMASQNILDVIPFFRDFRIGATRIGYASGYNPGYGIDLSLENAPYLWENGIQILLNYSFDLKKEEPLAKKRPMDPGVMETFEKRFRNDMIKYGKYLTVVESQNESNLWGMPEPIISQIRSMRKVLNEVAPHIKLAGPDPCKTDFAWLQLIFSQCWKELDIVSEHPYRAAPENPDYGDDVKAVRSIIDSYKKGTPHYATESGWVSAPIASDMILTDQIRRDTAYSIRNMLLGFGNGLAQYNHFQMKSHGISIEWKTLYMGNVENDGYQYPAPVLFVIRNAADRLEDGKSLGRLVFGYNYRVYMFDKGTSRVLVIWKCNGGDAIFRLKKEDAPKIRLYDVVGSLLESAAPFTVGGSPVYLESELSAKELEKVLRRIDVREPQEQAFSATAKIKSEKEIQVVLENRKTSPLKNLNVTVKDASQVEGSPQRKVNEIPPEKSVAVSFILKKPVSAEKRMLKLQVDSADGGKIPLELNLRAILVPKAVKPVKIDGRMDDWANVKPVMLTRKDAVILQKALWGKEEDAIHAELRYQWDPLNLYVLVVLHKKDFADLPGDKPAHTLWKYDSFQICFDPLYNGKVTDMEFSDDDFEYSLGNWGKQPTVYRRTGSSAIYDSLSKAPGVIRDVRFAVRDSGNTRIFEAAFPPHTVSPFQLKDGSLMRSSIIVNLNKDGKRIGYLELTPGVGDKKSPGKWMDTVLLP